MLEIHLSGINDLSIMFCICSEGGVFLIVHFINQFTSRKNKHIVIVINNERKKYTHKKENIIFFIFPIYG